MNMNATAQMVTTTQVGCGKVKPEHVTGERYVMKDHMIFDTQVNAFIGAGDACYLLNEAQAALDAELERANHNADIGDSIARASRQVEQQLREQLAAEREKVTILAHSISVAADALDEALKKCR